MTTDITELAQSLKAAAEKATPGQWVRSSVRFNGITDVANPMEQGNKPHVANTSEKRDAEFIALANPANILALVEALEKAQKSNEFLKGQLSELANFNPDWDKLEASYDSWREIAAELLVAKERIAELEDAEQKLCAVNVTLDARAQLAAMDSEPVTWINGCNKSVPTALRYLAENPRPIGGESSFNTAHLYQLAREIELMAEAPLYRHAQQPVVRPAPECQHQWRCGGANKLQNQKQCIKCGRVELDAQPAPVVPDAYVRDERGRMMLNGVCEPKIGFGAGWNACRAAMPQGKADGALTNECTIPATQIKPVADLYGISVPGGRTTTYSTDAAEASDCRVMGWSVQEYVKLERYQSAMLQGAENAESPTTMKTAPTLDSSPKIAESPSGNSPVIPDGYVMVPKEPTDEMIAAAMNCEDVLFNSDESFCVQFGNIYEAMLAAAPQEVNHG